MKNNMKKLFSTIIVFLMAFALMTPAGASKKVDPENNPKIDINKTTGTITIAKKGSEFSIYKILDADAKEGQNVFNYTENADFKDFFKNAEYDNLTINDIAKMDNEMHIINRDENGKIISITDPIKDTLKLTNPLQKYIADKGIAAVETLICPADGSAVKSKDLEIGFYLIVETKTHGDSASVASKSMLAPLPMVMEENGKYAWHYDLNITPKDEPVEIDKSIRIANGEKFDKVNISTNNVGDILDYEVNTTIPHYDQVTLTHPQYPLNIKYWITDTLSKGLSFTDLDTDNNPKAEIKVSNAIDGSEKLLTKGTAVEEKITINGKEEVVYRVENGDYAFIGDGLDGSIQIIFNYKNIADYNDLQLVYQTIINENAVIGVEGNPNEVTLEYTNNHLTGETSKPWDKTITYTYGLKINKLDDNKENPKKLAGAEFELKDEAGNVVATYKFDENGQLTLNGYTEDKDGNPIKPSGSPAITDNDGIAYLIGIKAGTYTLKETKAPDGYILPDGEMTLIITEEKDNENKKVTKVTYTLDDKELPTEEINSETVADGSYAVTSISNTKGFNLPRTGGAGTWMFTVGGILIMATMVTVFVKLKRKEN